MNNKCFVNVYAIYGEILHDAEGQVNSFSIDDKERWMHEKRERNEKDIVSYSH